MTEIVLLSPPRKGATQVSLATRIDFAPSTAAAEAQRRRPGNAWIVIGFLQLNARNIEVKVSVTSISAQTVSPRGCATRLAVYANYPHASTSWGMESATVTGATGTAPATSVLVVRTLVCVTSHVDIAK